MTKLEFFLLNLYHILIDGLYDSIPILLTFIVLYFGGGGKEIGYIVSCGALVATVCGLYTLFFSQRLNFRQILGGTALLYGIGFLANSFSPSIIYSGLFFVFAVAGHSVFHNVSFSHITYKTDRKVLGRALSGFTAYGDIGRVPLTALSAYIAGISISGIVGWRLVSFTYGTVIFLVGAILLLYKNSRKTPKLSNDRPYEKRLLPSGAAIKNKNVRLAILGSIINAFSSEQIFVFLPLLLLLKGFDHTILGSLAFGFTLGCFIGKTICGRLLDRFGTRKVFSVSQIILSFLLILLTYFDSLYLILFIALLLGIVSKGTVPVVQSMITEPLSTSEYYADIFTINGFARGVVNVLAPTFFGLIGSIVNLNFSYMIMALGALIAIIPILLIKPKT